MSEFEMAEAIKQNADAMRQNAAVNVASVATRQQELAAQERQRTEKRRESEQAWHIHIKTNALKMAVSLNQNHSDRTVDRVLEDADRFVDWFKKDSSGAEA